MEHGEWTKPYTAVFSGFRPSCEKLPPSASSPSPTCPTLRWAAGLPACDPSHLSGEPGLQTEPAEGLLCPWLPCPIELNKAGVPMGQGSLKSTNNSSWAPVRRANQGSTKRLYSLLFQQLFNLVVPSKWNCHFWSHKKRELRDH